MIVAALGLLVSSAFAVPAATGVAPVELAGQAPRACHPDATKDAGCKHRQVREATDARERIAAGLPAAAPRNRTALAPTTCHPDPSKDNACAHRNLKQVRSATGAAVMVAENDVR